MVSAVLLRCSLPDSLQTPDQSSIVLLRLTAHNRGHVIKMHPGATALEGLLPAGCSLACTLHVSKIA